MFGTRSRALRLLGLGTLAVATLQIPAQTITVRLLNGKSGKPLPNKNLTFHWGDTDRTTVVAVDANGIGHVPVPPDTKQFILVEGPLSKAAPHSIAFEDCNATSTTPISVAEVVTHGVTPRDTCGTRSAPSHPGEVVFWGRMRSWLSDTIE